MPPLSPEPGWARGDVWSERTATRCTAIQNAIEQINIPRTWSSVTAGDVTSVPGGDEALVDVEQRLTLFSGQLLIGGDGLAHADAGSVGRVTGNRRARRATRR